MNKILIGLIFCIQCLNSCIQKAEPETYLIPKPFAGKVNIIFNQKNGNPIKYENGRRVYDIPSSGIYLTQFRTNDGFINREYYYKDQAGVLIPLKIFEADTMTSKSINRNQIGIFLDGISGVYGNSGEPNSLEFQEFIVSSYNNLDSFFTDEYKKDFNKKIENISGVKF